MEIVRMDHIKKYYGTEPNIVRALDGVSLGIEKGKFVGVVGPSGSGKSTIRTNFTKSKEAAVGYVFVFQ